MTQTNEPRAESSRSKPRLAVFKFASCDGCQLQLLSCETELLQLGALFEIAHFAEASSRLESGPYDIAIVEGSITTSADEERIQFIRANSDKLITIGACATTGGIQALRNAGRHADFLKAVYAHPDYIDSLATSTPISDHVRVDFELRGCPIDKQQLLSVLGNLIAGHEIHLPQHSVCLECKRNGYVCVTVATGQPCLGPITHAGCGSLCPSFARGCYGCFGPVAQANPVATVEGLRRNNVADNRVLPMLDHVNTNAPTFREAREYLGEIDNEQDPLS